MIHMFWENCNEPSFYKHICKPDNFMYLNGKNVIYPDVVEIVWNYIKDKQNFNKIKTKLIDNRKIFQFVYSSVYPEVCSFVEKRGIELWNFPFEIHGLERQKEVFTKVDQRLFLKKRRFATTTSRWYK